MVSLYRTRQDHLVTTDESEARQPLGFGAADSLWRYWFKALLAGWVAVVGVNGLGKNLLAQDLKYPVDVAVGKDGTVYVADLHLPGIWRITDGEATVYFQASKKFRTPLSAVRCVALDGEGRLLAGDSATREVYRFDQQGKPIPLTDGKVGNPKGIAVRDDGEILVSDLEMHCIWRLPADGGAPLKWAAVQAPAGVCLDQAGNLWVVALRPPQLQRISTDGKCDEVVEGRPFAFPNDVAINDAGIAYVADGYGKSVWMIGSDGKPRKFADGKPLVNPVGLAHRGGSLLVSDPRARALFQINAAGQVSRK
jgi:sugar lactone lactonase YvrE